MEKGQITEAELQELLGACHRVLSSATPESKVAAARATGALFDDVYGQSPPTESTISPAAMTALHVHGTPADRPARPAEPLLVDPGDVPRRKLGSIAGRAVLLHAIAHIEFNAIDLAFDMAVRFLHEIIELNLNGASFLADWIRVGREEAHHFAMVSDRLVEMDSHYGAHPAHDGLWDAAIGTADSVLARLAIAPMVLEARGLDVTPGMIHKLRRQNDLESVQILQRIYNDEIGHVQIGRSWFERVCVKMGKDPISTFRMLVDSRFAGKLKEPFNHEGRSQAGLDLAFYQSN